VPIGKSEKHWSPSAVKLYDYTEAGLKDQPPTRLQSQASALTLLVLGVAADDADDAVAANNLAVAAHLLNRSTYFHL
jgi:hypothetical protein